MSRLVPDKFNIKDYNTFLKVRKTLCLNGVQKKQNLDLKKGLFQTLIKKHRRKKGYHFPVTTNQILLDGVCGTRVDVREVDSSYKSRRYRQVLLKQRNILDLDFYYFTYKTSLLKTIAVLRDLQTLKLAVSINQFTEFSRIVESLVGLKDMCLRFYEKSEEKKIEQKRIEKIMSQFCKHLASKRHLRNLDFYFETEKYFNSEEAGIVLLNTVADLNLLFFILRIPVSKETNFKPLRIQKFLQQVKSLNLDYCDESELPPKNKHLCLVGVQISNFDEILVECSSLEYLNLALVCVRDRVPQTLGLAKSLTELHIAYHPDGDNLGPSQLNQLLSEAPRLKTLFVVVLRIPAWEVEASDDVYNQKVREYLPPLLSSDEPFWPHPTTFKDFCQTISRLQSLKSLSFEIDDVKDTTWLELIFSSLVRLKKLSLNIKRIDSNAVAFPIQSLSSL